jgi:hypothetical protein
MESEMRCWLCGANGHCDPLDRHHIFGGPRRKKSERDGLVVYLCHSNCHLYGPLAVHNNADTMQRIHEYGERKWLEEHEGTTIEDFIREYGKNYL